MYLDLAEYYKRVASECTRHPTWRYGQVLFNTLYSMDPDLANRIRGGPDDPFHFDSHSVQVSRFKQVLDNSTWTINSNASVSQR